MKIRKLCAALLAASVAVSVFAGCGSSSSKANGSKSNESGKQELNYNLGSDPKTLDPALNQSVDGGIVLENLFLGLYKEDENGKMVPGIAESYDLSDDKKEYTFHLRSDATWSNGDPVKAGDFEYAWKRVLNPKTAAEYAYQMMYLKGAEEYNKGTGSADNVGVKAVDDKTLKVTLTAPCEYFINLTAFPCYFPVDQKVVEGNSDWANSADSYVSNGPFKLTSYKIKDGATLEKSDSYFDKDSVTLDKVNMKFVTEETTAWANYKKGDFDIIYTVPKSEIQGGVKAGTVQIEKQLGTYYYSINVSDKAKDYNADADKVLSDSKVRKALNLAIDRDSIIKNVTKGEEIPATSFVGDGITDSDGKDFHKTEYFKSTGDVDKAKELLSEAGYPDGEGFPTIELLYNPESGHGDIAQAVQDMWKTNLGINVELKSQEWKVFQNTRNNKQYSVARDGWVADYTDPMTFLDMLEAKSGQNNCGYNNPEFDKLVDAAKAETDDAKRMEDLHKAEDLLMNDMPVVPIYYYTHPIGISSKVKGFRENVLGFEFFDKVTVEK